MAGNVREYLSPPTFNERNAITVSSISNEASGMDFVVVDGGFASGAWTANLAMYVPLVLAQPVLVSQFFWINGGTLNGNTDVGIYSQDGSTKLGSTGSTGNSGSASVIQAVDVADFYLPSNSRLWLAIASDSGTQTYFLSNAVAQALDFLGTKQQTSAWSSGLPASATFATPSVAVLPVFGFTGKAVI